MAQQPDRNQDRIIQHDPGEIRAEDMRDRDAVVDVRGTAAPPAGAIRRETVRTPAMGYRTDEVGIPEALNLTRDRVRWGPVIAGFLTALTTLVVLGVLGAAVGFAVINAGEVAARAAAPPAAGPFSAIWAGVSGIIAFWLGGLVAGRTSAVFDRKWGAFNGAMVFCLAVPVTLWLATMGLGSLIGTLGAFAAALNANPGAVQNAAQAASNQAQAAAAAAQQATPEQIAAAATAARNAAWGALVALVLAFAAATLGGMMGTRRELELDRASGAITDK